MSSRYTCHYCQRDLTRLERTIDHIVPVAQGGLSVRFNFVICCAPCNIKKASQFPDPGHSGGRCRRCAKSIRRHWEILHIRKGELDRNGRLRDPAPHTRGMK